VSSPDPKKDAEVIALPITPAHTAATAPQRWSGWSNPPAHQKNVGMLSDVKRLLGQL
jgi:hypothetical protein